MARGYRMGIIGSLSFVPEGSTVTPTDDIGIWLKCAKRSENYTTLQQVLADSTCLLALIQSQNAVNYMVRSTTWASDVCANQTAMTDIGGNNYCANTLLGNSTWVNAIGDSTYIESVLNTKVPTLSSNTNVLSSTVDSGLQKYYAFNGNLTTDGQRWSTAPGSGYIGYNFSSPVRIHTIEVKNRVSGSNIRAFKNFTLQGSNDGDNWTDIAELLNEVTTNNTTWRMSTVNSNSYSYIRALISTAYDSTSWTNAQEIQFYGRVDV